MICISIAQESRRLALADMLNAGRQCDLLEVRLDRFGKAPELGELFAHKPKPIIMSCRRPRDGGQWEGSEEERLALLRQCIISKADYVEIELDVADQIRPLPPTKRVISWTSLHQTPADIAEVHARAQTKSPDVIKLTTLARTPEEAWPLVQLLARTPVPTVMVGLGKPGVMLAVLGKKIGAPWTYAALERGMEAYPDQPTVHDLESIYHYQAIDRATRLVGVTGFGARQRATVAALNAAFAHFAMPARCWPVGVGNMRLFRKIIEAVKLAAVVADGEHAHDMLEIAAELEPAAAEEQSVDLLLHRHDKWHGYQTGRRAILAALESAVRARFPSGKGLQGRVAMIVGTGAAARWMARGVQQQGGAVIIAGHDRDAAHRLAHDLGCRHVLFEAIYTTLHDLLIVCDEEAGQAQGRVRLHPGYLKPGMVVLDLMADLETTPLLREAQTRGCAVVTPRQVWFEQTARQARLLTGKDVPPEVLMNAVPWLADEEG
jgi:3-dehydroquinate dehydratase/shikimate dehydrogenase